jgi:hypothetical protein
VESFVGQPEALPKLTPRYLPLDGIHGKFAREKKPRVQRGAH